MNDLSTRIVQSQSVVEQYLIFSKETERKIFMLNRQVY